MNNKLVIYKIVTYVLNIPKVYNKNELNLLPEKVIRIFSLLIFILAFYQGPYKYFTQGFAKCLGAADRYQKHLI